MIKKMVYESKRKLEILHREVYKNHKIVILNLGTHPTAYVSTNLNIEGYNDDMLKDIKVHWGFSFYDTAYWSDETEMYLGWDYAHAYDYAGYYSEIENLNLRNHKWTTEEILEEAKRVVLQLDELERGVQDD